MASSPQRVIVTAGGAGIGRATAVAFAEAGADVFICDVNEEALDDARAAHERISGAICDVSDAGAVRDFIGAACDAMGGVDVLVNNAGVGGGHAPIAEITDEAWLHTIGVNLNGPFWCVREVAPMMQAQRSGVIINISTSSVRTGLPFRLPYVASKSALSGFTLNIARELGPFNIRCNAIFPGAINNERGRALISRFAEERGVSYDAAQAEMLKYVSMRTVIEPEEIAAMAVFLASDAARHVSGQEIGVCGNAEWEE